MKTSLPACPFCDEPRKGNFVCQKCGADLVWMIPWEEGGGALPEKQNAGRTEPAGAVTAGTN